jgi:hypothetical protein
MLHKTVFVRTKDVFLFPTLNLTDSCCISFEQGKSQLVQKVTYSFEFMYVCIYVCMYLCMYVFMYVCMSGLVLLHSCRTSHKQHKIHI